MTAPKSPHLVAGVPPAGTDNTRWKYYANCAGEDQTIFFPPQYEDAPDAKRICAACQVRDNCLEYALGLNIQHGMWGGLTIQERRKIRADRARARLASPSAATARVAGGVPCAARADVAAPALPCTGRAAHPT